MTNFVNGAIHTGKKVFVVAVHIAVAIGLTDILSMLSHNPNLQHYWPVMNMIQVAVVQAIQYYNAHQNDLELPPQ